MATFQEQEFQDKVWSRGCHGDQGTLHTWTGLVQDNSRQDFGQTHTGHDAEKVREDDTRTPIKTNEAIGHLESSLQRK